MDVQSVAYKEIPDNKLQARVLTNVSPTDWWVLAFTVLVMIASGVWTYRLAGSTVPMIMLVLFELLVFCAMMYRTQDGFYRMYGELYYGAIAYTKHAIFGGVWWKANDDSGWMVRWLRTRNGKRPALPFNFTVIRAVLDGNVERVAVQRELDRPYDHVYFTAEGGSFVTRDPSMQMRMVDTLASITNRSVSMANLKLGITYLRIVGPQDESRLTNFFGSNLNPIIANPEQFELDDDTRSWVSDMQKTLGELRPTANKFGAGRSIAVVKLTIKRDRKFWRKARGGKFSNEELYDLPVVELSRAMADALSSTSLFGFENVKVLGLADLAETQRCALDVVDIQQYYADRRAGLIPTTDDEIDAIVEKEGTAGLNKRLQCWPREEIVIGPDGKWMRIDKTYFAVLRVKQMPQRVRADQFLNLHYLAPSRVWTRIATVGQSVSGSAETRNLIIQSSALANFNNAFYANRIVEDPRRRRRQQQVGAQTEEISANTIAQFFNILVVVAASSERDVLRQRRTMKGNLMDAGFETHEVDDVTHIQNAVFSGVLGINRL
jgi:hypothetical protein